MNFEIGNGGIASIEFNVSLDRNVVKVKMTQSYEHKPEFYAERDRIAHIFKASIYRYQSDSVEVILGSYSEKTFKHLKKVVDILHQQSMIDLQRHDEIIKKLEERIVQVRIENDQETQQFAAFLDYFKTNIEKPYQDFKQIKDLQVDDSIRQLNQLICEVCYYRGNPTKVDSCWLYLFLSEGALEHLIKSLHTPEQNELKERIEVLRCGVTSFLQKYESIIHPIVAKAISKKAEWFQQLYDDYKSMIATGKSPSEISYCPPITNWDLGGCVLYLPSRFVK